MYLKSCKTKKSSTSGQHACLVSVVKVNQLPCLQLHKYLPMNLMEQEIILHASSKVAKISKPSHHVLKLQQQGI